MDEFKPKLQILVPQYKETEEVIKPLLDSIAIQQRIDLKHDISVIIVNDGSDTILSSEFLASYPYDINYILAEHGGVSATRNVALDHATADYVMWCDADDMFYITHALWILLRDINNGGFDVLSSVFLEEIVYTNNKFADLIKHDKGDRTFVHGKVYRRQYLIDNNIRWNPKLQIHEDVYFTTLALVCTQNLKYQDTFFYVWRYRDESICRVDPDYVLKTYPNLLYSNEELIEELLRREMRDAAATLFTFVTLDMYYTLQLPVWHMTEHIQYRMLAEMYYAKMYEKFSDLFFETTVEHRKKTASGIRERLVKSGMVMELISFPAWIEHIEKLKEPKKEQE